MEAEHTVAEKHLLDLSSSDIPETIRAVLEGHPLNIGLGNVVAWAQTGQTENDQPVSASLAGRDQFERRCLLFGTVGCPWNIILGLICLPLSVPTCCFVNCLPSDIAIGKENANYTAALFRSRVYVLFSSGFLVITTPQIIEATFDLREANVFASDHLDKLVFLKAKAYSPNASSGSYYNDGGYNNSFGSNNNNGFGPNSHGHYGVGVDLCEACCVSFCPEFYFKCNESLGCFPSHGEGWFRKHPCCIEKHLQNHLQPDLSGVGMSGQVLSWNSESGKQKPAVGDSFWRIYMPSPVHFGNRINEVRSSLKAPSKQDMARTTEVVGLKGEKGLL